MKLRDVSVAPKPVVISMLLPKDVGGATLTSNATVA